MKTAVCYYSRHHGNTLKVLEAMAQEGEIHLVEKHGGKSGDFYFEEQEH